MKRELKEVTTESIQKRTKKDNTTWCTVEGTGTMNVTTEPSESSFIEGKEESDLEGGCDTEEKKTEDLKRVHTEEKENEKWILSHEIQSEGNILRAFTTPEEDFQDFIENGGEDECSTPESDLENFVFPQTPPKNKVADLTPVTPARSAQNTFLNLQLRCKTCNHPMGQLTAKQLCGGFQCANNRKMV